jgi:3-polyprenyl-4-hydroxybenzoate decarboxylase
VSAEFEIAAIVQQLEQRLRMPVLEFRHVRGTALPLVTNVAASLPRIAKAAGWRPEALERRLVEAYERPLPPALWPDEHPPSATRYCAARRSISKHSRPAGTPRSRPAPISPPRSSSPGTPGAAASISASTG